jgi:hypothetical protein
MAPVTTAFCDAGQIRQLLSNSWLVRIRSCAEATTMARGVAIVAQSYQVAFDIFTGVAPKSLMVYFEVLSGSAKLTTPAIAPQHALA